MKRTLIKLGLQLSVYLFNYFSDKAHNVIDEDNDGSISQEEFKDAITNVVKWIDSKSRKLYRKIKK